MPVSLAAIGAGLKSPTVLKWLGIGTLVVSLFTWGYIQSQNADIYKLERDTKALEVSTLEESLKAEKAKAVQREADSKRKQNTIDKLNDEKLTIINEFENTKSQLDHILTEVIPNIQTKDDLKAAREVVEKSVTTSYSCIASATKDEPCAP